MIRSCRVARSAAHVAQRLRADAVAAIATPATMDMAAMVDLFAAARAANLAKPNVARVPTDGPAKHTTVCGDVHGQGRDFLNIFKLFGEPSAKNPFLFNGDLVDRGPNGLEICVILASYMVEHPGSIHINRGNHETQECTSWYGFRSELEAKVPADQTKEFLATSVFPFFNALPIAHIVDDSVFVVHGGPAVKRNLTVAELNALHRDADPPAEALFDMLWSDPIRAGHHGRGAAYREADTDVFLKAVDCKFLLRSHEMMMQGYELHHGGKCATVFSAPNYCGSQGNLGAVAKFVHGEGGKPHWTQFKAV